MKNPIIKPAGDSAVLLYWDLPVNRELNAYITYMLKELEQSEIIGIIEIVPAYCSLLIYYDPAVVGYCHLSEVISRLFSVKQKDSFLVSDIRRVTIPVFYGGQYGPDLEHVAEMKKIPPEEVIKLHCSQPYYVYMIGFLPGFPYLGFVDDRIIVNRKKQPRAVVERGSVGIAGRQTGIYSLTSPGGWQIIGRTPVNVFKPSHGEFLFRTGDKVIFKPIEEGVHFTDLDPDAWGELIG